MALLYRIALLAAFATPAAAQSLADLLPATLADLRPPVTTVERTGGEADLLVRWSATHSGSSA